MQYDVKRCQTDYPYEKKKENFKISFSSSLQGSNMKSGAAATAVAAGDDKTWEITTNFRGTENHSAANFAPIEQSLQANLKNANYQTLRYLELVR